MIKILKSQANTVILTLNEKKTTSNDDVLFEFINDMQNTVKLFTATDLANIPRYNKFIITDSTTENPYTGTMNFTPSGYWTYTIYEMPVASPVSLDPTVALGILEQGKVFVIEDDADVVEFEYNDDDPIVSFTD